MHQANILKIEALKAAPVVASFSSMGSNYIIPEILYVKNLCWLF